MAVYVDEARWPYRGMLMCHMFADTTEELLEMADRVGVSRAYIQKRGSPEEHFDLSKGKREMALRLGARPVSSRQLVGLLRQRRAG